jgi:hypothetical protein
MTHPPLHRSHTETHHIYHELHQFVCDHQESSAAQEDTYVPNYRIMSYILNVLFCVDVILRDNLLQCFLCTAVIYLSSTFNSTVVLICKSLFMFMIYFWIKIKLKVLIFLTIQKSYCRHFSLIDGFVDALRPAPFHWHALQEMAIEGHIVADYHGCVLVSNDKREGQITADHEKAYEEANALFVGAVIGAHADHL